MKCAEAVKDHSDLQAQLRSLQTTMREQLQAESAKFKVCMPALYLFVSIFFVIDSSL